jgi:hypothetical protein
MRKRGHLATATSLIWLAGEHLPTSMAALSVGNGSSAEMSGVLQSTIGPISTFLISPRKLFAEMRFLGRMRIVI